MNNQSKPTQKSRAFIGPKQQKKPRKKKVSPKRENFGSTVSPIESVPVAFSNKRVTGKASQTHLPNGDAIIEHTEYIADIVGTIVFGTNSYPVNPGMNNTFPWLSQIAPNYESYVFELLEFEYQNMVGSQTAGVVMLGCDYDASDPAPVSKLQFAAYQDYAKEAPWKAFKQRNRKENLTKRKSYYVRSGALSANQDIKLYDTANFFAATQAMANVNDTVGELYVKYRVRLMTPQLSNPAVGTAKSARVIYTGATIAISAGSNAPLAYTGTATAITITATGVYSGLVSVLLTGSVLPVISTAGSSATIENAQSQGITGGTVWLYSAQVSWVVGQVFTLANSAGTPATQGFQVGQFDTALL